MDEFSETDNYDLIIAILGEAHINGDKQNKGIVEKFSLTETEVIKDINTIFTDTINLPSE